MDKIDLLMCLLLLQNSRIPYRELGDKFGLSINAVHKRIQALRELGIIRTFTAKISIYALKAVPVFIFGNSEAKRIDDVRKRLEKDELTYWLAISGGNYLYVGAYLRNISELESYMNYMKSTAEMQNPAVGILATAATQVPYASATMDAELSTLDYRIIYSLRRDSRKAVSDVAGEIGLSAKTVGRRLSRMIQTGLIDLTIEWYPDSSNDIMSMFHLATKASADKKKVEHLLMGSYSPNILFTMNFSNLPNLMLCTAWANTMKELKDIHNRIQEEDAFDSVMSNVLYTGFIFDTWRDRLVEEKGAIKGK